jgi:PAS domain S-box-containing protein
MDEDRIEALSEENEALRSEVRVAREASEITARLVATQFEETDRILRLFQSSNAQRKAVLDAATRISIIATGTDGVITLFNSGAEKLLGYKASDMVGSGTPLKLHLHEELEDRRLDMSGWLGREIDEIGLFVEYASEDRPTEREWTYVRKDGSIFPVTLTVTSLMGPDGELTGMLFVAMDVTERKRAEQEILVAMRAAEAANSTKSAFLANMSHELRTPLNAIIGYSEMLQEEAEDLDAEGLIPDLKKIESAGKHLLALINDVLDLSKIEAGKMSLYLEEFALPGLVEDVVHTVHPLVEKNNNRLVVDCPAEIGAMHADVTRVRQVLYNLLSNACKFTDNGIIRLVVTREDVDGTDWIYIRVSDTGIGMSAGQMAGLFQAFSQADASTTRKYGGTGLGLAISRKFCNMMGGDMTVDSEQGKGTTFTASIPAAVKVEQVEEQTPRLSEPPAEVTVKPNSVLVIDDDVTVHDLMTRNLQKDGYNVVPADSGREGLRLAREIKPIAITLDVMMPGMDGWAVLKELKAHPDTRDIPVIMMTMVDDRNLGYALGATDYLTKPVEKSRLLEMLQRYKDTCEPSSVLVVEDDPVSREMVCKQLKTAGLKVCEAKNGRVALERIAEGRPCLIILDLMMPEMDGFEFVDEIRRHRDWADIPIVVLTAKTLTAEDHTRLKGGVRKILQKGAYNKEELIKRVCEQVVKLSR